MHSHSTLATGQGVAITNDQQLDFSKHANFEADNQTKNAFSQPPSGTFERTSFDQLLRQYDMKHDLPPTVELTQAFLLTNNMKETASKVSGLTSGGSGYFLKNEYVGDSMRMHDAMQSVSRLIGNLGTSDKASNFLLEQRRLIKAQARENREIRDQINNKIVDGLEYVRLKEQYAQTKSRVKELLEQEFTSDEEQAKESVQQPKSQNSLEEDRKEQTIKPKLEADSETQEDSEEAAQNKKLTEQRIKQIIAQLRQDAQEYLGSRDGNLDSNVENLSLQKICQKLRKNKRYRKRRELKALDKGLVDTLQLTAEQLKKELETVENQIKNSDSKKSEEELTKLIQQYEQIIGIDKRINIDSFDKSISEIDSIPINARSYELQNILFNFCGIDSKGEKFKKVGDKRDIFGKIMKIPLKSQALQGYQDLNNNEGTKVQNENGVLQKTRKKNQELVKMIGLDPEKLFPSIDKYKIKIDKMPKFSNVFERAEPIIPGLGMTVAGSLLAGNQGGQMTFARVDGRNVISLQFNPYDLDDPQKKKQYESAIKDIEDQRQKVKSISKPAREKQEQSNIKRAWQNIVKKDIPKAFRQFQKYQVDKENNNKKQSQNCLKEVRKKALKTQRLQKETTFRAKKLTKEMINFWKKRDKEIADLKKKKEKVEREMKRKQEEEKEALLQKKRLEFIMQQSEIYAHFMSKKLGLVDEQTKQRNQDLDEEKKDNFKRVDIDETQARNNVASMINENLSRVGQFDQETYNKQFSKSKSVKEEELQVDKFDNPLVNKDSDVIQAPSCFLGQLKDYQLKGMRWLDNLYEQGINGILADEMGLGKTIQAIALLSHLYERKGVWGPFLIIVPVTTLHNWQNELAKFCPSLKVLPYFGSPEERKKLGRFLDPKNLYNPNMRVNVLLTSYNLIVNNQKDQQKLLRVKWHYMILDEAQAIKNNLSRRWKVLLQFQTRNRLLLTGTPIQNSMAELWALLHFIMPKLFDSHEQFQEWFSKDIEQHSFNNQGEINKHQLRRLHLVLKPFMLRRLKKDVESEIGPKVEYEKYCNMTHRQKVLYHRIKSKISAKDLFQLVENKAKMENLMNLVMQFRKVCNHPELFERRIGRIPLTFKYLQHGMQPNPAFQSIPDLKTQSRSPIIYEIPKLIFDECFLATDNCTRLFRKIRRGVDETMQEIGVENHMRFFNIFNTLNMHNEIFNSKDKSGFSILRLLTNGNNWSMAELSYLFVSDPLIKQIALMHYYHNKTHRRLYNHMIDLEEGQELTFKHLQIGQPRKSKDVDINIINHVNRDYTLSVLYRENKVLDRWNNLTLLPPLVAEDLNSFANYSRQLKKDLDIFVDAALAEPVQYYCRSGTFNRFLISTINSSLHKKALIGSRFKPKQEIYIGRIGKDKSSFLATDSGLNYKISGGLPTGYSLIENGILGDLITEKGASILELPNYSRLVTDCAKMQFLDKLLQQLYKENHRVLIFCQMTRMLDILEDFLCWRKYTYFRMDGSTSIPDRRYMVEEYQKNPDVFAFLLSTRAGGLGVNLTAADTVVFYDNDWNPTMDAQATDRAHRIGQTKTVSVYRLVTKSTVEEKIVKRAKQKQTVQSTVYGGNALKADVFRPKDVIDMVFDEQEQNDLKERGQKFLKTKRMKKMKHDHPTRHADDEDIEMKGDSMMINTSSNGKEEKKKSTPSKSAVKKDENGSVPKKPGRKPNPEKQQKAPQNIFSTVKSTAQDKAAQSAGPFSVIKNQSANKTKSNDQEPIQQEADDNYDEDDEENEEEGSEEAEEDFFQLLEKDDMGIVYNDDDNPKPIEEQIFEDDEGGSKIAPKGKKGENEGDEDEEMADDY